MLYLKELREVVDCLPEEYVGYGIEDVFSWRGMYDQVAFRLGASVSKQEMLELLSRAREESFRGYKGGVCTYEEWTPVNFEPDYGSYTNGDYLLAFLINQRESPFAIAFLKIADFKHFGFN